MKTQISIKVEVTGPRTYDTLAETTFSLDGDVFATPELFGSLANQMVIKCIGVAQEKLDEQNKGGTSAE